MEHEQNPRDLDAEDGFAYLKSLKQEDSSAIADVWSQVGDDLTISMKKTALALGLHIDPELEMRANEAEKRNKKRLSKLRRTRGLGRFSIFG
jgi:hypothetical protein